MAVFNSHGIASADHIGVVTAADAHQRRFRTVVFLELDSGFHRIFIPGVDNILKSVFNNGTVLNMATLSADDRALFDALELGIATLSPAELGTVQAEPHPSWMTRIADDWMTRYGVAQ